MTSNLKTPGGVRATDQRSRDLASLLPVWPHEIDDVSIAGRRRLIAVLARALRAERVRGLSGHWAYDLARHAALHRSWMRERAELRALLARGVAPAIDRRL